MPGWVISKIGTVQDLSLEWDCSRAKGSGPAQELRGLPYHDMVPIDKLENHKGGGRLG